MKNIKAFLSYLKELNIDLWVEGDQLHCDAPKGTLSSELTKQLAEHKAELIQLLHTPEVPTIQHISREGELPLSFAQQRLWFIDKLEGKKANPYNIGGALRVEGALNRAVFEQSLSEIVQRHETLHTCFPTVNGRPIVQLLPVSRYQLPVFDLSDLSHEEQTIEVQRLYLKEKQRPFDLSKDSLFRASLLRLTAESYILLLTMHHIISDGWSIGVFFQELSVLYNAFSQGQPSPLPALEIQYIDFAHWQRQWLTGETLETQRNYWQLQLAEAPLVLEIPSDHPRPSVYTFQGGYQDFEFAPELTEQLKSLSQQSDATLFMTTLAAFAVLIKRYTGMDEFLIGTGIANRNHKEIEPLIGFFVNTLALRLNLSGNPTFLALLKRVQMVTLEAYVHQELPFEQVVEILQPERDLTRNPLVQVALVFQNSPLPPLELQGMTLSLLSSESNTVRFDLEWHFWEVSGKLMGRCYYYKDLFEATTIASMLKHFQTVLAAIVTDPEQPISALSLLNNEERQQLLVEWNQTQTPYPQDQCIHQLFEAQVEKTPSAVAVVFKDQQLTYGELNSRANQLAHTLQTFGVKPEVLVGICVERSLEMVIGLLGILKAGGAYVPLDPSYPLARLAFMLEDSQVSVLLTQHKLRDLLNDNLKTTPDFISNRIICLDTDWEMISKASSNNPVSGIESDNLAYVIYTSGSTGQPKGVLICHKSLLNLISWHRHTFEITSSDRATQLANIAFDAMVWELWPYLTIGASLYLAEPEVVSPNDLVDWLLSNDITISFLPTPLAEQILTLEWPTHIALRIMLTGGDKLHNSLHLSVPFNVVNNYGPTENTVVTTSKTVVFGGKTSPPIGRPIANTQLYILDNHLNPVPIGVPGELLIGGVGLARGYLKRPALTSEKFIPNPFSDKPGAMLYKTGDLARYLPDGNIEFLGRLDYQVKIRGFRIELDEIQAVLTQHPNVRESVVMVREDQPDNQRLVAYLVSNLIPERIPYQSDCIVKLNNGKTLKLHTEDISNRGVLLGGGITFEKGQKLTLRLRLPGESDARWLPGKVIWTQQTALAGIEFELTHQEQKNLRQSIEYLIENEGLLKVVQRLLTGNLRDYLKQKLPDYMVPSNFVLLHTLPLTPNGKIDRRALPVPETAYLPKEDSQPETKIERLIAEVWQQVLHIDQIGIHDNFFELGGHSLLLAEVQAQLQEQLNGKIAMVDLFEYPTIHALGQHISQKQICIQEASTFKQPPKQQRKKNLSAHKTSNDIAIIGMSGRFPQANDLEEFWHNLQEGKEAISFFSDEELMSFGIDQATLSQPNYVKAGAVLSDIEWFDAAFFDITPKEAEFTDPQQRLFLEGAWEAIEQAGYEAGTDEHRIGVYAGVGMNGYLLNNLYPNKELFSKVGGFQLMIENDKDFLTTRVSYKLNLTGPSINVQTACSTSLVAVHLACQSLLEGECDIALAGGVTVHIPQKSGYWYVEGLINSPDGHCRAFDADAQGTVSGSGMGIVVLRKLEDAIASGDCIHAIIKGSALNNDGSLKVGYTAPSVEGQAAVIADAQAVAGIEADSITYVETHGTGTALGDPIEIAALTKAFLATTQKQGFCAIGSLKTNIGHTDAAAGVAGLIKTVLALKHQLIPPSLHFKQPNPQIDFTNSPFYVNTKPAPWTKLDGNPRRAGVSSFGIGGTNAHVVLEEAPCLEESSQSRPWQLLLISAKTESALETATSHLAAYLEQHPNINLADVAYTLKKGRKAFSHRRMLVCQTIDQATAALRNVDSAGVLTQFQKPTVRPVVFMFTGQGAQYVNMGLELYQTEPIFRDQVDRCSEYLKPLLGLDLRQVLYPKLSSQHAPSPDQEENEENQAENRLKQTAITQPALFVIEYALAKLWMAWGVQPEAMIGHSIGEYVAACLANVFSVEEALSLVAARGQMMQQMPKGAMLSIPLPEAKVLPLLGQGVSLAAINAPSLCVVSGSTAAIDALQTQLTEQGVEVRRLHTSHAFHSEMMNPILGSFTKRVKQVQLCAPTIPFVSNVTGTWITKEESTNPNYWATHLRQTVRFADGLQPLLEEPARILIEIGPGRTLTTLARRHPNKVAEQVILNSLRPPQEQQSDVAFLLSRLGQFWLADGQLKWSGFYAAERRHRLPLPTYPFERQRYWVVPPKISTLVAMADSSGAKSATSSAFTGDLEQPLSSANRSLSKKPNIADWFYIPSWEQSVFSGSNQNSQNSIGSSILVFYQAGSLCDRLVQELEHQGCEVIRVQIGAQFAKLNDQVYTLNPQQAEDYETLLKHIPYPNTVVHFWTITADECQEVDSRLEALNKEQQLGFYNLLFLAQAFGKQNRTDEIQIIVVSNYLHAVTGADRLCPDKATVLGPIRSIPQEYQHIKCRSIDVALPDSGSRNKEEQVIVQLMRELTSPTSNQMIAYRDQERWVQRFEPVPLEHPLQKSSSRLREGGVYLITGGLGGIGLVLAEHLAKTVQAKLILTGRSDFPNRDDWSQWLSAHEDQDRISKKILKIQEIEQLGSEVWIVSVDVTNLEYMQEFIIRAKARFGTIHGVIHAAGVYPEGSIQLKTPEQVENIMAPKVLGAVVLDTVLKEFQLDFWVLCSSLSSILGGIVEHCGANAFLDAFAHYKTYQQNQFTVSINWDGWQEVGQAAEAAKRQYGMAALAKTPQLKEVAHPLFDHSWLEGNQEIYISHLSVQKHWVVNEHRVMGQPTLPGTAYLEMARAAFENHANEAVAVELREVYFMTPLFVSEDDGETEVRTILTPREKGFEFVIQSQSAAAGEGQWVEHAKGNIFRLAAEAPIHYNLQQLEAGCQEQKITLSGTEELNVPERFVKVGPRWNTLKQVQFGNNQGLALLALPEIFAADINTYQLHPALLDGATAFASHPYQGAYLPFSYKQLKIKGPLPAKLYSYITADEKNTSGSDTLKFNITIMDEQGNGVVEIEDYTLRRIEVEQPDGSQQTPIVSDSQNFCLEIATPGILDSLTLRPAPRRQPGPGEVEIEVYAAGLNFKEVLIALGMIPIPAEISIKFGYECAGKIVALGEGVEEFQLGDEVMALAPASFSALTITQAASVVHKPDNLTFEEAATIPVAFATAYYALITLGRLSNGERILIHAAAGGVGMAAVKIAQWVGAEIFATAGNPEKRAFLHSLGIQYVMDSRTLNFADEVMKYTEGKGVDVVMNSLVGDFIPKSLDTLAPFGRFLELGIRDIYNNTQLGLRPFEKGLSYLALGAVGAGQDTSTNSKLRLGTPEFKELIQCFKDGKLTPLPYRVFPLTEVASAFKYMAQAKHIGKVVVSVQDQNIIKPVSKGTMVRRQSTQRSKAPMLPQGPVVTNIFQKDINEYLLPSEGVEVFSRILAATSRPQFLVSTMDLPSRLQQGSFSNVLTELKKSERQPPVSQSAHPRPQLSQAYVAPRNALEQQVADIWQQFLGIEPVGVYDDFFELGGDSLAAVQLIAQLRETLKMELSPHSLLNSPNIAALVEGLEPASVSTGSSQSESIEQEASSSLLVEIKAGSHLKPPLFLIHPIGGHVYLYRDLANQLEQSVYGIQAQGLYGEAEPLTRIEDMATVYIEALQAVQPEGPYFLGGSSLGGMLAFEMAQQLKARGQSIGLLFMVDSPGPGQMPVTLETDIEILAYLLKVGANVSVSLDELRQLEPEEQLRFFLEEQRKMSNQMIPDWNLAQIRHFLHIHKLNAQAMWDYQPRIYQGKIIFFHAQEKDAYNAKNPEQAWIDFAAEGLDVIEVPGNHITINVPPHVQTLAERLKAYLP